MLRGGDVVHGEQRIPERRLPPWGALAYRDFRLLWWGLLISNVGTWMQFTSLTYLLGISMAHSESESAFNLGLLGATQAAPALLASPIAGFVADRYPRRRTLLLANIARVISALGLAIVSLGSGPWVLPAVLATAALFSTANSFDSPARNSWVSFLVPRNVLSNAVGLISIAFNFPMMVGPAIAGLLINAVGVQPSFFLNALAQCSVVIAVIMMKPSPVSNSSREPMLSQIATGIRFIASHPVLKWMALLLIVMYVFVRPYTWMLATYAGHVLFIDAKSYGAMLAAGGIGTAAGAVVCALWQAERRGTFWFICGLISGAGVLALAFLTNYVAVLAVLVLAGFGTMAFATTTNYFLQVLAPDDMRGRTIALQSIIGFGLLPLGTLLMGVASTAVGLPITYAVGGLIGIAVAVWIWCIDPALRKI